MPCCRSSAERPVTSPATSLEASLAVGSRSSVSANLPVTSKVCLSFCQASTHTASTAEQALEYSLSHTGLSSKFRSSIDTY